MLFQCIYNHKLNKMGKKLKFLGIVVSIVIAMSLGIFYEQFSEKVTAEKLMTEILDSKNIDVVSFEGEKIENNDVVSRGHGVIDLKNRKIYLSAENLKNKTSTEIYFVDNATYVKLGNGTWLKPKQFVSFDKMLDSQDENFDLTSFTLAGSNENILALLTTFYPGASNVTLNLKGEESIDEHKCQVIEGIHFVNFPGGYWEYERTYWIDKSNHKLVQIEEIIPKFENLRNETTTAVKYRYNSSVKIILPEEAKDAPIVEYIQMPEGKQIEIGMKESKTSAKVGGNKTDNKISNKTDNKTHISDSS